MVRVTLSNAFDLEGLAAGEEVLPRAMEVDAAADTGAIRSDIPEEVARMLGWCTRNRRNRTE